MFFVHVLRKIFFDEYSLKKFKQWFENFVFQIRFFCGVVQNFLSYIRRNKFLPQPGFVLVGLCSELFFQKEKLKYFSISDKNMDLEFWVGKEKVESILR